MYAKTTSKTLVIIQDEEMRGAIADFGNTTKRTNSSTGETTTTGRGLPTRRSADVARKGTTRKGELHMTDTVRPMFPKEVEAKEVIPTLGDRGSTPGTRTTEMKIIIIIKSSTRNV
jgi:hypothetical protein